MIAEVEIAERPGPEWVLTSLAAGVVGVAAVLGGAFEPAAALAVAIGLALVGGAATAYRELGVDGLEWALLACLGWSIAVAAALRTGPLAAKESIAGWTVAFLLLLIGRRASEKARTAALVLLTAASLLVVVGQVILAADLRSLRVGGVFENPNMGAVLLVPLIPLVLRRLPAWFAGPAAAVMTAGVLLSGSRAGLLALAAGLLLSIRRDWLKWPLALVVGLGGALIWWRFKTHPDALAWYRVEIWGALLELVRRHPILGVGPGAIPDAAGVVRLTTPTGCALHARRIAGAESTPLSWLVQTGGVGLVLALAAAGSWYRSFRKLSPGAAGPVRGVAAAMLVMALFHDLLQVDLVLWWWALVLGLAMADRIRAGGRPARAQQAGAVVRGAVVAGLVLWGLAQPAWARLLNARGSDSANTIRVLRLEPWLDAAPLGRINTLLAQDRWTWENAAEARHWSEVASAVHSGGLEDRVAVGRVNARIVSRFGAWPSAVKRAREGFSRACALEPRLPWHWLEWASLERGLGNLTRARELCRRSVAVEPNFVRGWLLLCRLDLDLGRLATARRDLDRAREARRCGRGRVLEDYDRDLMFAPDWQWQVLEAALP